MGRTFLLFLQHIDSLLPIPVSKMMLSPWFLAEVDRKGYNKLRRLIDIEDGVPSIKESSRQMTMRN